MIRGIVNTFGVYQTYYESALPESPSSISWIGSIQAYLLLFVGIGTGPLYDAGHFRALIFSGSFFTVFGMMMTSICHSYWEIMLSQAVCIGIGFGCLFVPSVAIVSTYFSTRKALATGIATAGSSLGWFFLSSFTPVSRAPSHPPCFLLCFSPSEVKLTIPFFQVAPSTQ